MTDEQLSITERWLSRIELSMTEGFARMDVKLDQKADKTDVQILSTQIGSLEDRVRSLEDRQLVDETINRTHSEHEDIKFKVEETKRDGVKTNIALIGTVVTFITVVGGYVYTLIR